MQHSNPDRLIVGSRSGAVAAPDLAIDHLSLHRVRRAPGICLGIMKEGEQLPGMPIEEAGQAVIVAVGRPGFAELVATRR